MRHLFDLDSPVMSALSTLLDFFVLSILTLLCSLPVVTAGAFPQAACRAWPCA